MVVVSVDCHLGEGMSMEEPASARLFDSFASVSDPRSANARHRLFDIFVIALCAVISGAEGWEDMQEYGQAQAEWFQQFLALPHGIPSHDTFRRVLSRLKPDELTQCFVHWTEGSVLHALALLSRLTGSPAREARRRVMRASAECAAVRSSQCRSHRARGEPRAGYAPPA